MGGQQAIQSLAAPPQRAVKKQRPGRAGRAGEAAVPGFSLQELAEEGSLRATGPEAAQRVSHGMAQEEEECWKHLAS